MINFELGFTLHVGRDWLGRVLLYLQVKVGSLALWVQRWDNERAPLNRLRTRSGMGWSAGVRGALWRRARALP
jgi:hypothetical protein